MEVYRTRLKERQRRKRIAREYALVQQASTAGQKKASQHRRKSTKEHKYVADNQEVPPLFATNLTFFLNVRTFLLYYSDLKEKLRPFARFHSSFEHKAFTENIQRESPLSCSLKCL